MVKNKAVRLTVVLETMLNNGTTEYVFSTGYSTVKVIANSEAEAKKLAKAAIAK